MYLKIYDTIPADYRRYNVYKAIKGYGHIR